jgi:folate-binding protein YgfZ
MSSYVLLDDRAILRLEGPDTRPFLQGLITGNIDRLSPDHPLYAALLTAQGKIIADFILAQAGEAILIDCAATQAIDLAARLKKFRLRAKVTITHEGEGLAVISSPDPVHPADGVLASFADPRLPELGHRSILATGTLSHLAHEREPHATYDRHRIECGVPDSIADLRPETFFPLDCNFEELHGVDFDKGCYVGQELTARMKHRATARKRILPVASATGLPPHGTPLKSGDTELGEMLGSQGPIGLAMLRLDRLGDAHALTAATGETMKVGRPHYPLILPEAAPRV